MVSNRKTDYDIGIYAGCGASHSWTWFADIFDKAGINSVVFLNEKDVEMGRIHLCSCFFISGGDTFAIAEGLGRTGAERIESFVKNGGTYIGSCAGAYLPLRSSISPLNMFNFVNARITNLTKNLPKPIKRAEKFCTEYGCRYVFHPVREEVIIKIRGAGTGDNGYVKAPLYGGPALISSDDIEVLADYDAFTEKTEFLTDKDLSHKTIIGNAAAIRKKYGDGSFYLFGPHLEHPDYPDANRVLFNIFSSRINHRHCSNKSGKLKVVNSVGKIAKKKFFKFLSEISNARIIALSMERASYNWLIGKKVYDPEKIRVFLEAMWGRAKFLQSVGGYKYISEYDLDFLVELSRKTTECLRRIKNDSEAFCQADKVAESLFVNLREATSKFLNIYFNLKHDDFVKTPR